MFKYKTKLQNNSERERQQAGASEVCGCIWVYLSDLRAIGGRSHEHFNLFYDPARREGPILPPAAALAPTIWPQFHLRWACLSESNASELESMWRTMNIKYSEMSKVLCILIVVLFCWKRQLL